MPGSWAEELDVFQSMIVLKALRPDKVANAMQDYVAKYMGQRFIEPQTSDLGLVYKDSSPTTPLVFVLSTGTDPANDLYKFAETMRFAKKLSAISLGQGQVRISCSKISSSQYLSVLIFVADFSAPTLPVLLDFCNRFYLYALKRLLLAFLILFLFLSFPFSLSALFVGSNIFLS